MDSLCLSSRLSPLWLSPLLASALLAAATSSAQTRPANAAEDDPVQLGAFEVTTSAVRGYATTSSLSASRISVPITDVPASVITINERLIQDTVAVDLRDTFNLVSGMNQGNAGGGLQEQNTFAIRGYLSSSALRDGIADLTFNNNGGFDYSMVERIEIVKGPAGVLYGQHSAGGVVDLISKRPPAAPPPKVVLTVGSYNFWRTSLDHSDFAGQSGKLGYRLSTAFMDTDGPVGIAGEPDGISMWINPSVSYQFDNGWKIWGWSTIVRDSSKRVSNSVWAFGTPDGRGRPYYEFAESGTASVVYQNFNETDYDSFEVGASRSFALRDVRGDFRLVARYGDQTSSGARTRSNGNTIFINRAGQQIPDGTPNVGRAPQIYGLIDGNLSRFGRSGLRYNRGEEFTENASLTADLNLAFELGPTKHDLLLYTQATDGRGGSKANADIRIDNLGKLPADIRQQYGFNTGITGVYIAEIWPNPPSGRGDLRTLIEQYADVTVISPDTRSESDSFSVSAIDRVSLFENRLIVVGGARYDKSAFKNRRLDTGVVTSDQSDSEWVGNLGIVYKPYVSDRGEMSLFYNSSETFVSETRTDQRLATFGQKFPNRVVSTDEFGAKINLLDNRLVGTVAFFKNTENNVLLNGRDETGSITGVGDRAYLFPGGERTTDGWEMDLAINPFSGLDLILSYSQVDALLSDGRPPEAVPETTHGVVARYEFGQGVLSGFSLTGIYTAWGESHLERGSGFIMPAGDLYTAVAGYKWRDFNIRLRVENILDEINAQPSTWWTGVGVTRGRNYRVSVGYVF